MSNENWRRRELIKIPAAIFLYRARQLGVDLVLHDADREFSRAFKDSLRKRWS